MKRGIVAALAALVTASACTSPRAVAPADVPVPQMPLEEVTPGDTQSTDPTQVCVPGWPDAHRKSLTAKQKRQVLQDYGLPPNVKVAELDHRISLGLGGANGPRNIWPQLRPAEADRKEKLENSLRRAVCTEGSMSLTEAQRRIRTFVLYW